MSYHVTLILYYITYHDINILSISYHIISMTDFIASSFISFVSRFPSLTFFLLISMLFRDLPSLYYTLLPLNPLPLIYPYFPFLCSCFIFCCFFILIYTHFYFISSFSSLFLFFRIMRQSREGLGYTYGRLYDEFKRA